MHVLVVTAHPRENSFTHVVAEKICSGLLANGCTLELADLYAENFDPRLNPPDEPDWDDAQKEYSSAVKKEMGRIKRADALIMVFPVWWWNMPAMLKGWIDRVWGYGFAYGEGNKLPVKKILAVGVAANTEGDEDSDAFFVDFKKQLVEGIFNYCGVDDADAEFFYDSLGDEEHIEQLLKRAEQLGRDFTN